jgi:hypothetical protein
MQRLYHIFRASGTRAFIPTLTGGVFRPIFYKYPNQVSTDLVFFAKALFLDGEARGWLVARSDIPVTKNVEHEARSYGFCLVIVKCLEIGD